MSESVRSVMERHHARYEVRPYYVVVEDRSHERSRVPQKIHAGFDVDVYGTRSGRDLRPSRDYLQVFSRLQEIAASVSRHATECCSLEVIPFGSTIVVNTKHRFEPDALVRIRITHGRGLVQPAGSAEEAALRDVKSELERLGVANG